MIEASENKRNNRMMFIHPTIPPYLIKKADMQSKVGRTGLEVEFLVVLDVYCPRKDKLKDFMFPLLEDQTNLELSLQFVDEEGKVEDSFTMNRCDFVSSRVVAEWSTDEPIVVQLTYLWRKQM